VCFRFHVYLSSYYTIRRVSKKGWVKSGIFFLVTFCRLKCAYIGKIYTKKKNYEKSNDYNPNKFFQRRKFQIHSSKHILQLYINFLKFVSYQGLVNLEANLVNKTTQILLKPKSLPWRQGPIQLLWHERYSFFPFFAIFLSGKPDGNSESSFVN